jgi:hypothetical protein
MSRPSSSGTSRSSRGGAPSGGRPPQFSQEPGVAPLGPNQAAALALSGPSNCQMASRSARQSYVVKRVPSRAVHSLCPRVSKGLWLVVGGVRRQFAGYIRRLSKIASSFFVVYWAFVLGHCSIYECHYNITQARTPFTLQSLHTHKPGARGRRRAILPGRPTSPRFGRG